MGYFEGNISEADTFRSRRILLEGSFWIKAAIWLVETTKVDNAAIPQAMFGHACHSRVAGQSKDLHNVANLQHSCQNVYTHLVQTIAMWTLLN